jgi:hypothetical protein
MARDRGPPSESVGGATRADFAWRPRLDHRDSIQMTAIFPVQ